MSFSSIQRVSPVFRALLPRLPVRAIAIENSDLHKKMQEAFKIQDFASMVEEWKATASQKWDGSITILHKLAEEMPRDPFLLAKFVSTFGNLRECPQPTLIKQCASIKDQQGNTPLRIALRNRNWGLVNYLRHFTYDQDDDVAFIYLNAIDFRPLIPSEDLFQYSLARFFITIQEEDVKDKNGWTFIHWLAFKGIAREFVHQERMESSIDARGVTAAQLADLLKFISDEKSPEEPQVHRETFLKLPKERQDELLKAIRRRNNRLKETLYNSINILPDELSVMEYSKLYHDIVLK